MGMAGAGQILGRTAELHDDRHLVDDLAGLGSDNVAAEHPVAAGIGQDLDETVGRPDRLGPAIGEKREFPRLVFNAGGLQFLFGLGPGAGKLMAQLVTGETPCVGPTPFRYSRYFDGSNPKPTTAM